MTPFEQQQQKRIAALEDAIKNMLVALRRKAWQDGPTIFEATTEAHDTLHSGEDFEPVDCPICKGKP